MDDQDRKHTALRDLSDADRAYRAAFDQLTSLGGLEPSTFDRLLASVNGLREVVEHLRDADGSSVTTPPRRHAEVSGSRPIRGRSQPRSRRRGRTGV